MLRTHRDVPVRVEESNTGTNQSLAPASLLKARAVL